MVSRVDAKMPSPGCLFDPRQMELTPSGQWKRGDIKWSSRGSGVVYEASRGRSARSYRALQIATVERRWVVDVEVRVVKGRDVRW